MAKNLQPHQEKILQDVYELVLDKNSDYSGNRNFFGNFEKSKKIEVTVQEAMWLLISNKVSRVSSLLETGEQHVKTESLADSLKDIIGYSYLLYGYARHYDDGIGCREEGERQDFIDGVAALREYVDLHYPQVPDFNLELLEILLEALGQNIRSLGQHELDLTLSWLVAQSLKGLEKYEQQN